MLPLDPRRMTLACEGAGWRTGCSWRIMVSTAHAGHNRRLSIFPDVVIDDSAWLGGELPHRRAHALSDSTPRPPPDPTDSEAA